MSIDVMRRHLEYRSTVGFRIAPIARVAWTIATILVVETVICGFALFPVAAFWSGLWSWTAVHPTVRLAVISAAIVPSYVAFGLLLMLFSGLAVRALKWRTHTGLECRIADLQWPLLEWVRAMVATHIVRVIAGTVFRGSPIWSAYLRLCGARLGRRVYVNSLAVSDYNLLDFGDDAVIGDGVHLSGHTVEHGYLKTASVRLGCQVMVGVGSIVEIGVEVGDGCQIGAMSLVPKYERLDAGTIYAGIPVRKLEPPR